MENTSSFTMKVILCIFFSNCVNWNDCNFYRLHQILLQLEEELLRNGYVDDSLEGISLKPKKNIEKIKVQRIVTSDAFHGVGSWTVLVTRKNVRDLQWGS